MVCKKNFYVCFSFFFIFFLCQNILLFSAPQKEFPLSPGQRSEVSLHGMWEFQHTTSSAASAPVKKWDTTSVPGLFTSAALGGSQYTWFKKEISIPHEWENQRIFLYLGGARFEPHVFINNKFIAKQLDGWVPFYLWIPFNDFSPGSVFFGDDAYINLREYKLKAKALTWEYQTLAYRRAGVSGMCPWTFAGSEII